MPAANDEVTIPRDYAWSMSIAIVLLAIVVIALIITMARRRSIEEALRDSEKRFRLLAENVPGVIYLCKNDARYTMLFLSNEVEELTGYSKDDFINDRISFVELYHPDDAEAIVPLVEEALGARLPFHLEYRLRRKDGTYVWIEESGVGVFDSSHELKYLEGHLEDITERKAAEQRQNLMMAELDHRVKNNLATLSSIVRLTLRATKSREEFENALSGRIQAMAQAHELFAHHRWGNVPIAAIIERTIAPFEAGDPNRITISGPRVDLPSNRAQTICMIMHELATNAAKYGALLSDEGQIIVEVARTDDGGVRLQWTESGGPDVQEPRKGGFGLDMIRGVVTHDLKGEVTFHFEPEGVRCLMILSNKVFEAEESSLPRRPESSAV